MDPDLISHRGKIVHIAGDPVGYMIEPNPDERRIDHLSLTVRVPIYGVIEIALNTCSLQNLDAGFDPRIRAAIIESKWSELPSSGIFPSSGFDYSLFEATNEIGYIAYERKPLEQLLIGKLHRARFIEGWGELYLQPRIGIHQVHSRRASQAIATHFIGRDGAVRFYFAENKRAELLLLKFAGQN